MWKLLFLLPVVLGGSVFAPTPNTVTFRGQELYVDGKPFYIKGLCYSPVPVGESPQFPPFGDYFVSEYAYIWKRDLPLIKELGVNTIRIYGWDTTHNITHYEFLDEVHKNGLKILLTFYVGTKFDNPPVYINSTELQQVPITNFTREAGLYGDHPAILLWSFGNELNGPWNGFLEQISSTNNCGWAPYGSCWNAEITDAPCMASNECLYRNFFGWIDAAATQVKVSTSRPVISGMADVDRITDKNVKMTVSKLQLYGQHAPNLAAWAFQLYRGASFGNYFKYYKQNLLQHPKPLIVTEYGTDAYNDPCGWPQNNAINVCKNMNGDAGGGVARFPNGSFAGCKDTHLECDTPGEEAQAQWDVQLTQELYVNRVGGPALNPTPVPTCTGPWEGFPECAGKMTWLAGNWQTDPSYAAAGVDGTQCSFQRFLNEEGLFCPDPNAAHEGVTIGAFMMAWMDEFWKGNIITEGHCNFPCNPNNISDCWTRVKEYELGKAAGCTWKAHWDCPNKDPYYHGLCGYKLEGAPDFYINEEWFGMTMPVRCGHSVPTGEAPPKGNPQKYGLDTITVRSTMKSMQQLWAPENFAKNIPFKAATCEELLPCWQCIQDHPLEQAAFLNSCFTQCDIVPFNLPPTVQQPTVAAPTPGAPTMGLPPSPGNVSAPTAAPVKKQLTIMFTQLSPSEHEEFILELSTYFEIPQKRIEIFTQRQTEEGVYLDFWIMDEEPTPFDEIVELMTSEFEFLAMDPDRGCNATMSNGTVDMDKCHDYLGNFIGKCLDKIDPRFAPKPDGFVVPPTASSPTQAAPTQTAPTGVSPTAGAPTTGAAPTMKVERRRLTLKLESTKGFSWPDDVGTAFSEDMATYFKTSALRFEFLMKRIVDGQRYPTAFIDFNVVQGDPTIDDIQKQLVSELTLLQKSHAYGCGGNECTNYTSALTAGRILQYVSPFATDVTNPANGMPPISEPTPATDHTGIIIAGVVFGAVLIFAVIICARRFHKQRKFAENALLGYEATDPTGNYVAATVPTS